MAPIGDTGDGRSDDVVHRGETLFIEVIVQPVDHVLDDAVAVVHYGGADLNVRRAVQHEFDLVSPVGNSADAADRDAKFGIAGELTDHVERDRFYGGTAGAAMGGIAAVPSLSDTIGVIDPHPPGDRGGML